MNVILCQNITIFYRQKLASLFQVQEKLKACRNAKWNFLSSCFIAEDSHVKIVGLHVVVSSKHDILHFWDNVHLLKYYPVKISQNCFCSFNYSNQTGTQVSKFSFALDMEKSWFKVFVNCRNKTVMEYFSINHNWHGFSKERRLNKHD